MFTWECPTCGRELDVSQTACPTCNPPPLKEAPAHPAEGPAHTAAPAVQAPPPAATQEPQGPRHAARPTPPVTPPPTPRQPAKATDPFHLSGKHIALFLLLLVAAVGAAVFFSNPDVIDDARLALGLAEPGPTVQPGRGNSDPIEVAGLRWVEPAEGENARIRAVVINHSPRAQTGITLDVRLRPLGAPFEEDPIATFTLAVEEPLEPGDVREVEAAVAMEPDSVQPPWHDLRIDIRRVGSR